MTGAEQQVGGEIYSTILGVDTLLQSQFDPTAPQGLANADLDVSLSNSGVSLLESLTSVFSGDQVTVEGIANARAEWGSQPTGATDVHGGGGSMFTLYFTRESSPAYFHVHGQIDIDLENYPDLHPEEVFVYVRLSSDSGSGMNTIWEETANGGSGDISWPVAHGLWLEDGKIYRLEAYAESGTMADPTHHGLKLRMASFSFTTAVYGVSFPDYFPLDAASHGLKTFQWTHGRTGSYQSYISGTLTVPYTSGAIEGTGIVNMSDLSQLYATNDGSEVKWIAYAIETEFGYISTDCSLADHPASWTFSTVTDDMLLDQGTYYFVDPSLTPCEMDNKQSLLFDIQDVSVPFGQYDDAVIIWWLDEQCSFTALDFSGKDIDLGITLPNGTQTGGHSVTAFDVYAYGIGMIACGDIAAETGELLDLAELVNIESSGQQVGDFCGPPGSEQADGYVDYWDLLYFAQRWHSSPSDTNWDPRCDLDKEKSYNYVDYWDLLFFAQQWHKGQKPK